MSFYHKNRSRNQGDLKPAFSKFTNFSILAFLSADPSVLNLLKHN